MPTAQYWIDTLSLLPHPEGGWYRETYRCRETVAPSSLPSRYGSSRSFSTCIYYLLRGDDISTLHQLKQDEIWHFHDGSPLEVYCISQQGTLNIHRVGRNPSKDELPQLIIPAGTIFGARLLTPKSYALISCTVSPGFEFEDFSLLSREELLGRFPQHKDIILSLTRR